MPSNALTCAHSIAFLEANLHIFMLFSLREFFGRLPELSLLIVCSQERIPCPFMRRSQTNIVYQFCRGLRWYEQGHKKRGGSFDIFSSVFWRCYCWMRFDWRNKKYHKNHKLPVVLVMVFKIQNCCFAATMA